MDNNSESPTYLDDFVEAYEESSPYSLDSSLTASWYPRRIIECAAGSSMLELGIGHGKAVATFSESFTPHVVVEGSKKIIERYKNDYPNSKTCIEHRFFEDFETNLKFDAISMGFVLEHVENPVAILRRFAKFLSPDGVIFIAVPNATSLHRQLGFLAGLMPDIKQLGEGDLRLGHQRYYDISSLRKDISKSGLEEVSLEGIFLKPFTSGQMATLKLPPEVLHGLMEIGKDYPELCNSVLMSAVRRR